MHEPTGILMDIKPFAVHDGPGIRTTFFLKGCPLRCIWCHNPEGIASRPQMAYYPHKCTGCGQCVRACPHGAQEMTPQGHVFHRDRCVACGDCVQVCLGEAMERYGRSITLGEALDIALRDRIFYENSGGGVTISGGEPLMQVEFAAAFLKRLKAEGLHTAVDTCGAIGWDAFEKVIPYTDLFLYDFKHIDTQRHRALTGMGNERPLDNLRLLSEAGAAIEVRMPLIPGINDSREELVQAGRLLSGYAIRKMKILPYHAMARSKYEALGMEDTLPHVESPDDARLDEVAGILQGEGVHAISGRR